MKGGVFWMVLNFVGVVILVVPVEAGFEAGFAMAIVMVKSVHLHFDTIVILETLTILVTLVILWGDIRVFFGERESV